MASDERAITRYGDATGVAPMASQGGERVAWTLDQQITTWLHEKGRKSVRTAATYRVGLASYRALVQSVGFDLDSDDVTTLATLLQGWAATPRADGAPVSAALHNQRLALVSSFYRFRRRRYKVGENPADTVDREAVQAYARATPLAQGDVRTRLAAIDRLTLAGQRDYALLAVALFTGRRLSEIAAMRRRDIAAHGQGVTIIFPHAKGGKVLTNVLNRPTGEALLGWLRAFYGADALEMMADDTPIWVSLARTYRRGVGAYGHQLSIQSLADICQRWLGTSKFHATRHSFAHMMETLGAKVSDIQAALGHSNIVTTGVYLTALNNGENAHADALADAFGITATPTRRWHANLPVVRH